MNGYKFIALALTKSIYYSHRIEMVGEFDRAKDDVKICKATLFEIFLMGATEEINYTLYNSFKSDIK